MSSTMSSTVSSTMSGTASGTLAPKITLSPEDTPMTDVHAFPTEASPAAMSPSTIETVAQATRTIAPLWPLKHFVAVNPFLGLAGQTFAQAAQTLGRVSGARLTMPRSFYADAIASGRLTDAQLAAALAWGHATLPANMAALLPSDATVLRAVATAPSASSNDAGHAVQTVSRRGGRAHRSRLDALHHRAHLVVGRDVVRRGAGELALAVA